jgi:hypothetical protein
LLSKAADRYPKQKRIPQHMKKQLSDHNDDQSCKQLSNTTITKKRQTATKPHLERRTAIQNKNARQQQIAIKHKTTKAANRYELALLSLTCISALTHDFCLHMKCGCPPPEQHRSKYVDAPSIRAAKGRFLLV